VIDDARREGVMINVESLYHLQLKPLITKREHLAELKAAKLENSISRSLANLRYDSDEFKALKAREAELRKELEDLE
jgi:hypothetical protein